MDIGPTATYNNISTRSVQPKRDDLTPEAGPKHNLTTNKQNSSAESSASAKETQYQPTDREQQRIETNAAILQAHQDASISSRNAPLSLLYKTALEALRVELEPILKGKSIEEVSESGLDTSPEATAERIVSLSTGFFSSFKEQNPELTPTEQIERFTEVISTGIDRGFTEARDVLGGLKVLEEGDIADNIDKTYQLVQEGLADFRDKQLNLAKADGDNSGSDNVNLE